MRFASGKGGAGPTRAKIFPDAQRPSTGRERPDRCHRPRLCRAAAGGRAGPPGGRRRHRLRHRSGPRPRAEAGPRPHRRGRSGGSPPDAAAFLHRRSGGAPRPGGLYRDRADAGGRGEQARPRSPARGLRSPGACAGGPSAGRRRSRHRPREHGLSGRHRADLRAGHRARLGARGRRGILPRLLARAHQSRRRRR